MIVWYSVFFFFKQKTAYEMRISDWSSDVCSSDLPAGDAPAAEAASLEADQAMSADGGSANDLDVDLAAESFHHDSASDNVGLSGGGEDIDFDSFAEADGTPHDHLLAPVGERFGCTEAIVAGPPVAQRDAAGHLRAQPDSG